jgi:hypothetical protein
MVLYGGVGFPDMVQQFRIDLETAQDGRGCK